MSPTPAAVRKATVIVRLKGEVLDPQGDAVRKALGTLGFEGVASVRIGKIVEIELAPGAVRDDEDLGRRLGAMADQLLANPVIEDYEVVVTKVTTEQPPTRERSRR